MATVFSPLSGWSDFYVIVGSAAAALTGLQFVVIALAADRRTITQASARAFATPTIFHFGAVLLISTLFSAPWRRLFWPALSVSVTGLAGLFFSARAFQHARRQKDYLPVFEDWVWHFGLPFLIYAVISISGFGFQEHPEGALFATGILQVILLFIGIHNAWDSAVYIAAEDGAKPRA